MPSFDPAHIVLATLVVSFVLFVSDAVRYEVVALGVVVTLVLTGVLDVEAGFGGFSSSAVVLIAAMYVFGHAFTKSGLAEGLGRRILGSRGGEAWIVLKMTALSGLLSSVLSNTGVVATLIPIASATSRRAQVPLSRLLIPLAFGSLVGGLVTVIATSTNIAINDILDAEGQERFELFEFSALGLVLVGITTLFFAGPGRWLLPRSKLEETLSERYQVPKFVTEVLVEPTSELINRSVADVEIFARFNVAVLGIVRAGGERPVLAPGPYNRIRSEDTLILQGAPDDLLRLAEVMPLQRKQSVPAGDTRLYSDDVRLVEAVLPAGSAYVAQSLAALEFRTRTGLNVLALSRHGELQLRRIQDTPLEIGDTLLVQGHLRDIARARRERQLLVLDELQAPVASRKSWVVILTLAAVLLGAALTSQPLAVLGLAGAMALVLTGVVSADEVPRVIDFKVVALVGGMLALGRAFVDVGLAESVAGALEGLAGDGMPVRALMAVVLVATMLLTQVLNNVSTAAIMTPVAIELALTLGVSSKPMVMAVVAGSSLAFLSPVAHQANAMVMGPGAYRYRDFLKVGLPLAVITGAATVWLVPRMFPF
ncbi:MAG: SLC13 family permease [Planctomycetota bacterium]